MLLLVGIALAAPLPPDEDIAPAAFSAGAPAPAGEEPWWPLLGDPHLDEVVALARRDSPDVLAASARADQARAATWSAGSALLPSVSLDASTSTAPTESMGFQFGGTGGTGGGPNTYTTGSAMVNSRLGLDLFGRSALGLRSARLEARAAEGDLAAVHLTLAQRVAATYLDLVAAQERVGVATEQITAQEGLLELVELRHARGEATAVEVLQQRQQLSGTRAQLPVWRSQVRSGRWTLAAAVGRSSPDGLVVSDTLPELPPLPPVGRPIDLATHRPDVRAAGERLAAARARSRQALAALAPTLGLSGRAGWQFIHREETETQETWSVGTSASVPLFQGGAGWASVRRARATESAALQTWRAALLDAVRDVEGALARGDEAAQRLDAARTQEHDAALALDEARLRWAEGAATYTTVYTALSAWQQAQLGRIDAHRSALAERAALHTALGGPWTELIE